MKKYSLVTSNRVIDGNTKYLNLKPLINPQGILGIDEFGNLGLIQGGGVTPADLDARVPVGGSSGQVLKKDSQGNNTWQNDANTTYNVIGEPEFQQGTQTAGRVISALGLNRDIAWKINQPNVLNGNALRTDSQSGVRIPRFDSATGAWTVSITANTSAAGGTLVQRDNGSTFNIGDATANSHPVALGQLQGRAPILAADDFMVGSAIGNTGRKILPSDVKTDSTGSGNRVPVFVAASNSWISSLALSQSGQGNTIAQRTGTGGRVKCGDATENDDAVTLGQLKGGVLLTDTGDGTLRRLTIVNGVLTVSPPIT